MCAHKEATKAAQFDGEQARALTGKKGEQACALTRKRQRQRSFKTGFSATEVQQDLVRRELV